MVGFPSEARGGRRYADGSGPRSLSADRSTNRPCDFRPKALPPGEATKGSSRRRLSLGHGRPCGHATACLSLPLVAGTSPGSQPLRGKGEPLAQSRGRLYGSAAGVKVLLVPALHLDPLRFAKALPL